MRSIGVVVVVIDRMKRARRLFPMAGLRHALAAFHHALAARAPWRLTRRRSAIEGRMWVQLKLLLPAVHTF